MKINSKLSSIDYKRTSINYIIMLLLGILVVFALIKFGIWKIIAPADKAFIVLMFIVLCSTLGIRYKDKKKKKR